MSTTLRSGRDRRPGALGEPEVVLRQRVLRVVRAADHAAAACDAAGAGGAFTVEERVGDRLPGRAEVDADARLRVGLVGADLAAELAQELVGGVVRGHGDHAEHPFRGVVVRRERGVPVGQARPLRIAIEAVGGAVERVRVAERAAADAGAGDHHDVAEQREPEDPAHPQPRGPEVAPQVPRRARHVVVGDPPAGLDQPDAVALLREPERRDAAAEARADDEPVVVEVLAHREGV